MVIDGGSSRKGESVCQPEPNTMRRAVVGFLDQRLDFGKSGHAVGIGILRKRPEQRAEGVLLGMADLLAA